MRVYIVFKIMYTYYQSCHTLYLHRDIKHATKFKE